MSKKKQENPAAKKSSKEPLQDIAALAEEKSVSAPLMAALHRMTGWEDGKQVTESEFTTALDRLHKRPLGGGR